jgi:hypothetical protein
VRRSEAVKAYLVSKGVEKNRIYTEGKGEKQPVADNKSTMAEPRTAASKSRWWVPARSKPGSISGNPASAGFFSSASRAPATVRFATIDP